MTYMVNLYSWNRGTKARRLPDRSVTEHLLGLKRKYPEFVTLTTYIEHLDQAIAEGGVGNCQTGRLLMNIDHRGNVARCTERLDEPVGNILTEDIRHDPPPAVARWPTRRSAPSAGPRAAGLPRACPCRRGCGSTASSCIR